MDLTSSMLNSTSNILFSRKIPSVASYLSMKQLLHTESVLHENTPQPIPIEVTRQKSYENNFVSQVPSGRLKASNAKIMPNGTRGTPYNK